MVCTDDGGRVLLLRWNLHGEPYWEPPGGGLRPDESPLAGARRELAEETGLPSEVVLDRSVVVHRDFAWFGVPTPRIEHFFAARVPGNAPAVTPEGLSENEHVWLTGQGWFLPTEFAELDAHLEPPNLCEVVRALGR